jgi:hypothetical protein
MSEWIDIKYIGLISPRLEKFKVLKSSPYTATFRCFVCGDSQRNKYKTRGYFIGKNGSYRMYCHNCNISMSMTKVLGMLDPELQKEYKTEIFINKNVRIEKKEEIKLPDKFKFKLPVFNTDENLKKLKKISQLAWDHPAKQYVIDRMIPNEYHAKLYYAPKFAKWVNSMIPEKLSDKHDEPRLIIPLLDKNKKMFGFSGRAFHDTSLRYITIMLNEDCPKIFNMDSVDWSKRVYCLEGPLDATFIPNSIAMVGADLVTDEYKPVMIFDNECRSKQIIQRMNKYIDDGFEICIWPEDTNGKDINKMVLNGKSPKDILKTINDNIYHGLRAKARLSEWRKVNE